MIARIAAAALPLFLIAGCASDGSYPSLAPRAIEKVSLDEPEPAADPMAAQPTDPATAARLADLVARADKGAADFDAEAVQARAAVSASGARTVGSEGWIAAQLAVSRLDSARDALGSAVADLDALRLERIQAAGGDPAIDSAWTRVSELAARQDAAYQELVAALPSE